MWGEECKVLSALMVWIIRTLWYLREMEGYQKRWDRVTKLGNVQGIMNLVWGWLHLRCLKETWVWGHS